MAKIIDNYILLELIGQGTFGEIHKGRNLISKEAVAVKTIKLDKFLNDNNLRDMIINEIQALKKLDDPHIVKMIKMLKSANNIYLVYEYLNGCQLGQYFKDKRQQRNGLNEQEAMNIFTQICRAFQTLQREKILKKNLNMENIYINEGKIKLTNFFVCKSNYSQKKFSPESFQYVAPELLAGQQPDEKCDVYSSGLILYELLTGSLPFKFHDKEELIQFYTNCGNVIPLAKEITTDYSDKVCYLLQNMIQANKDLRFGWDSVFMIMFENDELDLNGIPNQAASNTENAQQLQTYQNQQQEKLQTGVQQSQQQSQNNGDQQPSIQASQLKKQETMKKNGSIIQQNKENIDYKINKKQDELAGCQGTSNTQNSEIPYASHKRESSLGLNSNDQQQLFTRSIQQFIQTPVANIGNNSNAQQSLQNQLKQNKIIDLIIEKRSKIIIMTAAISKCLQMNKYIVIVFLLLKKAYQISQQLIILIQNPEKVIPQLIDQELSKWKNSKKKLPIVEIIEQENSDLLQNLIKTQEDFFPEGTLNNVATNQTSIEGSIYEELHTIEVKNQENIDQVIFQTAKQLIQQDESKEAIVLAHFLADIANLNNVFKKFLGKKRVDILNHPYFKKLGEIQKEKLLENLESKFKLYEYQKLE